MDPKNLSSLLVSNAVALCASSLSKPFMWFLSSQQFPFLIHFGVVCSPLIVLQRLGHVVGNAGELLRATRIVEFFSMFYQYLICLLPAAVIAPLYFRVGHITWRFAQLLLVPLTANLLHNSNAPNIDSVGMLIQGEIQLGVVTQSEYAFMHVLRDVSLVVFQVIT